MHATCPSCLALNSVSTELVLSRPGPTPKAPCSATHPQSSRLAHAGIVIIILSMRSGLIAWPGGGGPVVVAWNDIPPYGTKRKALRKGDRTIMEVEAIVLDGDGATANGSGLRKFATVYAKVWDGLRGTELWETASASKRFRVAVNVWTDTASDGTKPPGGIWFR